VSLDAKEVTTGAKPLVPPTMNARVTIGVLPSQRVVVTHFINSVSHGAKRSHGSIAQRFRVAKTA
jgi:hypothetical protein